jgi:uncharacterized membrane protein YhdT
MLWNARRLAYSDDMIGGLAGEPGWYETNCLPPPLVWRVVIDLQFVGLEK